MIPNGTGSLGSAVVVNNANTGTYAYTGGGTNLRLTVPIATAFSIDLGGGTFLNGTVAGRMVANAAVPEPSTFALAGLGMVSLVALVRRRRRMQRS